MARMRYEVVLAPEAARSYRSLPAYRRAEVRDALERHLRHEPTRVSKSRIKRLRGLSQPQYRLRVGEDRKSTRLNSSHSQISYAVFCLKKKKKQHIRCEDVTIHYTSRRFG